MPVWLPTKFDMKRNVFTEVQGVPGFAGDAAFDSELKLSQNGVWNHMLQLKLRIFLDKFMPPAHLTSWVFLDFNKRAFIVGPWNHAEWHRFVAGFKKQCSMWNNKFWLVPPADFSTFDTKVGAKNVRPNVYCCLNVEILSSPAGAHRTIKVVNLDAKFAAKTSGQKESQIDSGDFRSDSSTYDTFDVIPSNFDTKDPSGNVKHVRHYTVAHEIGHALGQDHIGVIRHEKLCDVAIFLDKMTAVGLPSSAVPAMMAGAENSDVCYGDFAATSVSANVMGVGGQFEPANAQPWLEQMTRHILKATPWKVSMLRVPPKALM